MSIADCIDSTRAWSCRWEYTGIRSQVHHAYQVGRLRTWFNASTRSASMWTETLHRVGAALKWVDAVVAEVRLAADGLLLPGSPYPRRTVHLTRGHATPTGVRSGLAAHGPQTIPGRGRFRCRTVRLASPPNSPTDAVGPTAQTKINSTSVLSRFDDWQSLCAFSGEFNRERRSRRKSASPENAESKTASVASSPADTMRP